MARIRIESIVEYLAHDMKNSLESAVKEQLPNATIDKNSLFRSFKKAVGRKCSKWMAVPDNYVDSE